MLKINQIFRDPQILHLDSVNSTNQQAGNLLSKSKPNEGTVISSYNQYDGKGQIGSSWFSSPDQNIAFSIIFYPTFLSPEKQFLLSQFASLVVQETIHHFLPTADVKIKWPNDIYLGTKKVCGILIQNQIQQKIIQSSIIGIGLNVNEKNFPDSLPNPTSLALASGNEFQLNEIVLFLKSSFLEKYKRLAEDLNQKQIQKAYVNMLFQLNETHRYRDDNGKEFSGIIEGVSKQGQLLVKTAGKQSAFSNKQIKYLLE